MKYKIVKYIDSDDCLEYTLCPFQQKEEGEVILVFEAESDDQAHFIKNQFLHFEPYRPFGKCWLGVVRHVIRVGDNVVKEDPYEIRQVLVIASTREEAMEKIRQEAIEYSAPYQNIYNQDVKWVFDKILSLEEVDFFSTIDLYKGIPVEISSKRVSE